MKKLFILVGLLLMTACSSNSEHIQKVSATQAQKMMQESENALIIDVRSAREYQEGHIPEAIHIDNEQIQKADRPLEQIPDTNQTLFLYCRSGNRSNQAAKKLESLGYTDLIDFGGIQDWDGPVTTD